MVEISKECADQKRMQMAPTFGRGTHEGDEEGLAEL